MKLVPPEENLKASVVVPARDEEDLIRACLEALAAQENIAPDEYEVILVLDDCTDATEPRARQVSKEHPDFRLHFLYGPGKGAGHARRVGMEAACQRLIELGKPAGIIASTDADTVVAPDWLSTQLAHAARGARAIGGRIELAEEESLQENVSSWRREQGKFRHKALLTDDSRFSNNVLEHWQFSGASLALTAAVYEEIGGLEPLTALEDEYLERVLQQRGIPIERPLAVRVKTSARQNGRAERGLAQDLALASWFHNNTYRAPDFDVERLRRTKRLSTSLVLLAEDYPADTLSKFAGLKSLGILDEVLSVGSSTGTGGAQSPVDFYPAEDLMPQFGPVRGYGDILWRALSAVRGELVVVLGPAQEDTGVEAVIGLLGPLVEREELSLVKGFRDQPDSLSELLARPLINLHHPGLAGFAEPLSKSFAARSRILRSLPFPVGPGVDISLLLDAAEKVGPEGLAQSFLGERTGNPAGDDETAYAILAAAAGRRPEEASKGLAPGPLFVPGPEGLTTRRVPVEERPPLDSLVAAPVF